MQRKIWLVVLVAAVVLLGGSAAWADDFYVIAGGGPPVGTKITSIDPVNGLTISKAGFYFLGADLTYSGTSNAITIAADNVTLDLMGFSLIGPGPVSGTLLNGVYMAQRTNVEIRNGTVRGFSDGIYAKYTDDNNHRVINIRANNNLAGIYLNGTSHLIKNCSASNNSTGIILSGAGSLLGNTVFNNNSYNFYLGGGVATSILVDRNSALSSPALLKNYYQILGTTGVVITANNSGTP